MMIILSYITPRMKEKLHFNFQNDFEEATLVYDC